MEFFDRDKKSCSEPHRSHGSLLFRDGEATKEGEKRYPHGTQITFHCIFGPKREKNTWQVTSLVFLIIFKIL